MHRAFHDFLYVDVLYHKPHQWPSSSVLKVGRREVQGSIPGRTCRPSCSKFFVVFFVYKYGKGCLKKNTPLRALSPSAQVSPVENWLNPTIQHNNTLT